MSIVISGIQQIGVGIPDVYTAWGWYRKHFGMDIPIFDEAAEANLMLPYTDGKPQQRHAVLAYNLQGGGGLEIWQYVSRTPQPPSFTPQLGDLGIYITKIKTHQLEKAYSFLKTQDAELIHPALAEDPNGTQHFMLKDPYGNLFQVLPSQDWFKLNGQATGGVVGCLIGVSDIDQSLPFYSDLLGYDRVILDQSGHFSDWEMLPGGDQAYRRVQLEHTNSRKGPFSRLLGRTQIELVQALDRTPQKIFAERLWGDMGFIHLCFDIQGMKELRALCKEKGYPFTVDSSNSFDMGEAAGHFSYVEDPDGTLIEFVETHKIPIIKKLGWYLHLKHRDPEKPLPNWMLQTLSLSRVKSR